ncbi:hypothetical protein DRA43_29620 [Micromonospora provocatoris]|nr:hypothetical protein [Micromonospora provocatoris]RBI96706.1 hypothetical protein DRA43_29620 [Micromonospora provocatoris]
MRREVHSHRFQGYAERVHGRFQGCYGRGDDLRQVADVAAGRARTVGVEQPQHGDLQTVALPNGGDDRAGLLPPRLRYAERRQRAERTAGGVEQDERHGAGHGRTVSGHPYGRRAD